MIRRLTLLTLAAIALSGCCGPYVCRGGYGHDHGHHGGYHRGHYR